MLQYLPLSLIWNWLFLLWNNTYKTGNRAENICLSCITSLNEWSWIYEGGGTISPPRFLGWLVVWVFLFQCLGDLLFLQFLLMTWDASTGQFFWWCWFNLCCCIGTWDAGVSQLLLLLPQFITSLWPLLQGQTVVPSYSTLMGAWFHCVCVRSFAASSGINLEFRSLLEARIRVIVWFASFKTKWLS